MNAGSEQFRQVLRGYEPSEVDRRLEELARAEQVSRAHIQELTDRLHQVEQTNAELVQQLERGQVSDKPAYEELGSRIGQMLSLADEEATELRSSAKDEADAFQHAAHQAAERIRTDADKYAEHRRGTADAEAESVLKAARRQAEELLDGADRDASARRQEAEAVYETQRAKAAAAAADFEMTLAQRRESAENEFTQQLSASHEQLATMEAQVEQARGEVDKQRADAEVQARRLLEDAEGRAAAMVAQAQAHADRIRTESERELTAATQRRDSINAQLSNVRQMLATLSGAAPSGLLFGLPEEDKPAPAADVVEATPSVAQAAEPADEPDVDVPEAAAEADSDAGEQG